MNISGKYLKVWKVEVKEKYVSMDLGESKKKKDGSGYDNWTLYDVRFVGDAKNKAMEVNVGDLIEITSGVEEQYKGKDGKYYINRIVFHFDFMQRSEPKQDDFGGEVDDDLPY